MLMCVINSLTTNVKLMGFYFFYPNQTSFIQFFHLLNPYFNPSYIFSKMNVFHCLWTVNLFWRFRYILTFNKHVYFCTICEIILS